VKKFAEILDLGISDVIKELMKNKILATINDEIDFETAAIIAEDMGFSAEEDIESGGAEAMTLEKLDEVLKKRIPHRLFRLSDGSVPDNWNKPFRQWLEDSELLNCPVTGKERSLYSLRHYYATQRLLEGIPIHDLAEQMGTSVLMITKHYSHLTPLMKAKQFAGVVDETASTEAAQIKAIMSAQMANNNIMNLVQMGTGLVMPLIAQNSELTDDFENRLKAQRKKST
jgi:hypothetical protein